MRLSLFLAFIFLALVSCGDQESSKPKSHIAKLRSVQKWPVSNSPQGQSITVETCWVKSPEIDEDTYKIFADAISKEYDRTAVRFQGWQTCGTNDFRQRMLRMRIDPSKLPYGTTGASYIGRSRSFLSDAGETTWFRGGRTMERKEIVNGELATALHEVGHALGLLHEQDREDSTCQRTTGSSGISVGNYDPQSIMNYCRGNRPAKLTSGDIAGIHTLYSITNPVGVPSNPNPGDDGDTSPKPEDDGYTIGQWIALDNGRIGENPVIAGDEGRPLYACRFSHKEASMSVSLSQGMLVVLVTAVRKLRV